MNIVIRPERDADREAIWHVPRAAFETENEANLVDALREGGFVEVQSSFRCAVSETTPNAVEVKG